MCEWAVDDEPEALESVPDHLKMQEMCNEAVGWDLWLLQYVPDWFVTREWVDMWYDDSYDGDHWDDDEDKYFEW